MSSKPSCPVCQTLAMKFDKNVFCQTTNKEDRFTDVNGRPHDHNQLKTYKYVTCENGHHLLLIIIKRCRYCNWESHGNITDDPHEYIYGSSYGSNNREIMVYSRVSNSPAI